MSVTWAVLDVGCLECADPTEVILITQDEDEARARFEEVRGGRPLAPVGVDVGPTCVAAGGSGGSYWYHLQLHRFEEA